MPIAITIIITLGLIFLIWNIVEPRILTIRKVSLNPGNPDSSADSRNFEKITITEKTNGLKILFFSDLHVEFCFIKPSEITALIESEKPDAVVFGGDFLNNPNNTSKVLSYLKPITDTCRKLNIPFAGVTGNHDTELSEEALKSFEFIDLRSCGIELFSQSGKKYYISGVNDSGRANRAWFQPSKCPEDATGIIVAHNPDSILHLENPSGYKYMLSGHIHGGQIRTPFGIEFTLLRSDELPRHKVITGSYEHKKTGICLYISNGIGCVKLPFRFLCRPDVSVIEFE